ncbi:MAG: hypothetical protein K6C36_04970 [Clostridia bacterium]|nr:hypothetical protein [Clostridia bacterium]
MKKYACLAVCLVVIAGAFTFISGAADDYLDPFSDRASEAEVTTLGGGRIDIDDVIADSRVLTALRNLYDQADSGIAAAIDNIANGNYTNVDIDAIRSALGSLGSLIPSNMLTDGIRSLFGGGTGTTAPSVTGSVYTTAAPAVTQAPAPVTYAPITSPPTYTQIFSYVVTTENTTVEVTTEPVTEPVAQPATTETVPVVTAPVYTTNYIETTAPTEPATNPIVVDNSLSTPAKIGIAILVLCAVAAVVLAVALKKQREKEERGY